MVFLVSLMESVMERSKDKYKVQIDNKNGMITYDDKPESKRMVQMPHAMKLLIQELEAMSVGARLITEESINEEVFNHLNKNISKHSIEKDFLDDDISEEED